MRLLESFEMKRIAIFCDGTWNRTDPVRQTNVVKMAQTVAPKDAAGNAQVVVYVPGVGTGRGSNALARSSDKIFGGAFGWGLNNNIIEAYRALIFLYEPGDEIYIFGFSRGAFTARSLAGLIRSAGILTRQNVGEIPRAMDLYRTRGDHGHPDNETIQTKRAALSPAVATSKVDLDKRGGSAVLLRLAYLGVWDTVGAMGMPGIFGLVAKAVNAKYLFHDMVLSSSVASARHAVAIDERRRTFPPSLWDNIAALNTRFPARGKAPDAYQQKWFAGDHGSIGGGGEIVGLSAFSFGWVAEGAEAAGLVLDAHLRAYADGLCDAQAPIYNVKVPSFLTKMMRHPAADRAGPSDAAQVHDSVVERIALMGDAYDPGALKAVKSELKRLAADFKLTPPKRPG